ncbi:unnamed protein product [Meloidogyne enterolobii]|uniref:Uncharacterized protein n=2 Tax=Meloidogyne enterolobii TaxID=390850 RepID=A0A6V7X9S1_MELEN|nr:unnamed protein product [Meloidogyne enterolobii]
MGLKERGKDLNGKVWGIQGNNREGLRVTEKKIKKEQEKKRREESFYRLMEEGEEEGEGLSRGTSFLTPSSLLPPSTK